MTLPDNFSVVINIIIAALIIFNVINGYRKGFLRQVLHVLGVLAAIIISYILAPGLSELIHVFPQEWAPFQATALADLFYGKINELVWFVIIFIVCMIILFLIRHIFDAIGEIPILKSVNKLLGSLVALIPTFLHMLLITFVLSSAIFANGTEVVETSLLRYTNTIANGITGAVSNFFSENVAIQKMLNDPMSLTEDDLSSIIKWMENSEVTSEEIYDFLIEYGIDTNEINDLINSDGEDTAAEDSSAVDGQ